MCYGVWNRLGGMWPDLSSFSAPLPSIYVWASCLYYTLPVQPSLSLLYFASEAGLKQSLLRYLNSFKCRVNRKEMCKRVHYPSGFAVGFSGDSRAWVSGASHTLFFMAFWKPVVCLFTFWRLDKCYFLSIFFSVLCTLDGVTADKVNPRSWGCREVRMSLV